MLLPLALWSCFAVLDAEPSEAWLVEISARDLPFLVQINRSPSGTTLRRAKAVLKLTPVSSPGSAVRYRLEPNLIFGRGEIEFSTAGTRLSGSIETERFKERIFGVRLPRPFSARSTALPVNGPGFSTLKIENRPILERMTFHRTPGLSMARFSANAMTETGCYGVADTDTAEPVTEKSRFQAGGMGSVATHLAALKLAGQGRLNLNEDVNKYLKGWTIPAAPSGKTVKVVDLLRGTSGLRQYKFRGYRPSDPTPSLTDLFRGSDPDQMESVVPGANFGEPDAFNGINAAVLQSVIERATGGSFGRSMTDLLFRPLRMVNSTYEANPKFNITTGHYESGEAVLDRYFVYPMLGDSGLWTNATDFARLLMEANRLINRQPNQILPTEKLNLLDEVTTSRGIAGFVLGEPGRYLHGGDTHGHFCNFSIEPKTGAGVIVMTNRLMNYRLVGEIIGAAQQLPGGIFQQ